MTRTTSLLLATCLLSANVQAGNAIAVWNNSHGNAAHTGYLDVPTQLDKFKVRWTREYSKPNDHQGKFTYPIVVTDHLIYFSISDGSASPLTQLYALNKNDGTTAWHVPIPDYYYLSGPVYENGRIYLMKHTADTNSQSGAFESYDAETGQLQNSASIPMSWYDTYTMPTVLNNHVYIGRRGKQLSVDGLSGAIDWLTYIGGENQNPLVTNDYVIRVDEAGINVLMRQSGGKLDYISANNPEPDSYPMGEPIWNNKHKMVYAIFAKTAHAAGPIPSQLTAFNLESNTVAWKIDMPAIMAMALAGDKLYFSNLEDNRLYEADALTGKINWYWQSPAPLTDIVVTRDTVFGFCYANQKTYAISRKTHDKIWELNQGGFMSLDKDNLYIMNGFGLRVDVTAIALH